MVLRRQTLDSNFLCVRVRVSRASKRPRAGALIPVPRTGMFLREGERRAMGLFPRASMQLSVSVGESFRFPPGQFPQPNRFLSVSPGARTPIPPVT